jgi:ABC-2 type transport system permease protein
MLRVGLAEAIAYRAETLVWMLTNTMPLVNLALWHAIARSGPIAQFGQKDLVAYFLATLIVRQLTGSWVLWEMSREIRAGTLSMRMLRPVHPLIAYSAENLSALPLRAALVLPIAVIALITVGAGRYTHDPMIALAIAPALLGAWLITFFSMAMMGTLGFFIEQSASIFEVWLALYFSLSGYLFPLDFFKTRAPWVAEAARRLPFYSMNGFPVELILGLRSRGEALAGLGQEWAYVAVFFVGTLLLWRAGMRRYNAYGA